MDNKGSNNRKIERTEINSALRYTRSFVIFGLIIVLLAVLFFTWGCQSSNKTVVTGLGNAYVNSAQSRADYVMATQKANESSLSNIGVLFKAAAMMEEVHMTKTKELYVNYSKSKDGLNQFDTLKNIKKYNDGMSVVFLLDSTKHSLAYFMGMQSYLVNSLFESLAAQAEIEKNFDVAQMYIWFTGAESSAYRLFADAYNNFSESYLFSDKYNVCSKCGSIYIFGDNIQDCTVCGESSNKFILVQ